MEYHDLPPHSADDYAAFVGCNVHKFLNLFLRIGAEGGRFDFGWNWAAFFFSFWWFLYRKMYLWAAVCFVTMLIPSLNLLVMIGWAVVANWLYYKHATANISLAKQQHGTHYALYLPDRGGVNGWVPLVALLVSGGFFLLFMLGFFSFAVFTSLAV